MVNQEIFGGLVSALSRGESLQGAMMSLFNAGYSKKEIEEAALLLNSRTPTEIMQKVVHKEKEMTAKKAAPKKKPSKKTEIKTPPKEKPEEPKKEIQKEEKKVDIRPIKESQVKQVVSKYGKESPKEFKKIVNQAIKSLNDLKSTVKVVSSESGFKPPIIIQHVSNYSPGESKKFKGMSKQKNAKIPSGKKKNIPVIILVILLIILLGSLVALFIFKDKLIEFLNGFSL